MTVAGRRVVALLERHGVDLCTGGPCSLLVKVTAEEAEVSRIPFPPAVIRDRFRASVLGAPAPIRARSTPGRT